MNDNASITLATRAQLNQLEVRVLAKLGGRIRDLQMEVDKSGIILRGFTRTYYAKQLAQHAVMAETHVPILANEIIVC